MFGVFRCSGVPGFSTCRENQIIVPCKEPIKIEKPLQCLLTFSYSAGEKYSSDCFVDICFFSFYFLIAFQSDNNSNRVYVLGHKLLFCFINQVDIRAKLPTSPLDSSLRQSGLYARNVFFGNLPLIRGLSVTKISRFICPPMGHHSSFRKQTVHSFYW